MEETKLRFLHFWIDFYINTTFTPIFTYWILKQIPKNKNYWEEQNSIYHLWTDFYILNPQKNTQKQKLLREEMNPKKNEPKIKKDSDH